MNVSSFFEDVMPVFLERLIEIVTAPIVHQEMLWILFPAITTMILMTIYFGRYRNEELGWNTAVGNALVLIFVSLNLFEQAYPQENPLRALSSFIEVLQEHALFSSETLPGVVAGSILVYAVLLLVLDFFHILPKNVAFFISSPLPINTVAYFGIVFVYSATAQSPLALDGYTFSSFIVIFLLLYTILGIIQLLEPHKKSEEEEFFDTMKKKKKKDEDLKDGFVDDQGESETDEP